MYFSFLNVVKYLICLDMSCWRKVEINWTVCVKNYEVKQRVNEEGNSTYNKTRKANCIGHMLRRNCLLNTLLTET